MYALVEVGGQQFRVEKGPKDQYSKIGRRAWFGGFI